MNVLDSSEHLELLNNGYTVLSSERVGSLISTPKDLNDWLIQSPIQWQPYLFGQSRRSKLAEHVYTVSEYSSTLTIPTHHELSYTSHAPRWLIFYAHLPPVDGVMHLLDGQVVAKMMKVDPLWSDRLTLGFKYSKCMPSEPHLGMGQTWKAHFGTDLQKDVEAYLSQHSIEFEWLKNGWLRTEHQCPTFLRREHEKPVWFSQPRLWDLNHRGVTYFQQHRPRSFWPTAVQWGDGTDISSECFTWLDKTERLHRRNVFLNKGELLIVDNHRIAHGRGPFSGLRQHWVAMGDGDWLNFS